MPSPTMLDFFAKSPGFGATSPISEPFATMTASLTKTSLARSTLVIKYTTAVDTSFPRSLYTTTPYPAHVGGRSEFALTLANGGSALDVSQVDLEIPGGYDLSHHDGKGVGLFADAPLDEESPEHDGVWTRISDHHLQWKPDAAHNARHVAENGVSSWVVNTSINGSSLAVTDIEPLGSSSGPVANLAFSNGVTASSQEWGASPGIIRIEVPPNSDSAPGYPTGGATPTNRISASVRAFPGILVRNDSTSYSVIPTDQDALALSRATQNATFEVENRTVNLGQDLRLHGDMQSLVSTLKQQGINSGQLTVDVYAPPSLGCRPTTHISKEIGALPHAKIEDVWLWDGDGTASAIVAADDQNVYRVSSAGLVLGSASFSGIPISVLPRGGVADGQIVVADTAGFLTSMDRLLAQRQWSRPVGTPDVRDVAVADAAPVVGFDEVHARLVVGTGTAEGTLAFFNLDGSDALAPLRLGSPVLQVGCDEEGTCYALTSNATWRVEPTGAWNNADLRSAQRFALGDGHVLVVDAHGVRDYSPILSTSGERLDDGLLSAVAATSGDATGDGVDDLVVARSDLSLAVFDGATARQAWESEAQDLVVGTGTDSCHLASSPIRYDTGLCPNVRKDADSPRVYLAAGGGHTVLAASTRYGIDILGYDESGRTSFTGGGDQGVASVKLRTGSWLTVPSFIVGRDDGVFDIQDLSDGETRMSKDVSQFAGLFDVMVHVPDGAFFGSHLAVATLSWTNAQTGTQSAQLLDWFEVLDADGHPVTHPTYRLIVVARDPSQPLAASTP